MSVAPSQRLAPSVAAPTNDSFSPRRAGLLLVAITSLAAFLHFLRLSHPPLWIDECFTFWRVCGSYDQLIETLRDDGFVPLHYELLWSIGKIFPLTPFVMRLIPAICGTMMAPIMYFLARQLFGRRTSLLAALLIATSAYVCNYSRDAKMYMPAWTFATLAMAGLLWWLRTQRFIAWQVWVAAALTAAGTHIVMLLLLPLAPLLLLLQRRHRWHQTLLMILGIAIILAGPAGYYFGFNQWNQRSGGLVPGVGTEPAADANWRESGLGWIGGNVDGIDMLEQSASAYLMAYEFRGTDNLDTVVPSHPVAQRMIGYSLIALIVVFGLCALPWPRRWRGSARDGPPPQSLWRSFLVLGAWIVLPTYCFFYCRSVPDFSTPSELFDWLRTMDHPWYCWPATAVWLLVMLWFSGKSMRERLMKLLQLLAICAVLITICCAAAATWRHLHDESMKRYPDLVWRSVFQVRYMGIIMPAVWLAAATLLMRLPTRPLRWLAITVVVGINLVNGLARTFADTEPPLDWIYADAWKSQPNSSVRTYQNVDTFYMDMLNNPYWRPAGAYSAWLASRMPTSPPDVRLGKAWPFEYGQLMDRFRTQIIFPSTTDPARIAADVKSQPKVTTIIVWEVIPPDETTSAKDPILEKLGGAWKMTDDRRFIFRRYWTWEEMTWFRRREYSQKTDG